MPTMQLPTEYFCQVLGRWRKYSCCLYRSQADSLDQAEAQMLGVHTPSLALACVARGLPALHCDMMLLWQPCGSRHVALTVRL